MSPAAYHLFDGVADAYNPLLALLALLAPWLLRPRPAPRLVRYYGAAALGIGFVYLVRAVDDRLALWPSLGLDYSTHAAFAASLVVSLVALHRRWLAVLVTSLALYFALALFMRYHGVADLLSAGALAAAMTYLIQRWVGGTATGRERGDTDAQQP